MISLTDSQSLCTAKINNFHQQPRFYGQIRYGVKVHANEERGPLGKLRLFDTFRFRAIISC